MSDTAGTRDGFVDQLLLEAGMDDDGQLRPALLELRALADTAPEPSAAVAALMAPAGVAASPAGARPAAAQPAATHEAAAPDEPPRVDELAARRRAKRRIALTTLSVAVSLSAGGAVAAASDQGIRESFTQLNHTITAFVTGSGASPAGHQTEQPAAPLPTAPAGTAPAGPAAVPADPAEAAQPAAAQPSNGAVAPETPSGQPASPGKPGEVPAPGTLPGDVPGHVANGLGKAPEVPVPVPSQVPLPGDLPSAPLP